MLTDPQSKNTFCFSCSSEWNTGKTTVSGRHGLPGSGERLYQHHQHWDISGKRAFSHYYVHLVLYFNIYISVTRQISSSLNWTKIWSDSLKCILALITEITRIGDNGKIPRSHIWYKRREDRKCSQQRRLLSLTGRSASLQASDIPSVRAETHAHASEYNTHLPNCVNFFYSSASQCQYFTQSCCRFRTMYKMTKMWWHRSPLFQLDRKLGTEQKQTTDTATQDKYII